MMGISTFTSNTLTYRNLIAFSNNYGITMNSINIYGLTNLQSSSLSAICFTNIKLKVHTSQYLLTNIVYSHSSAQFLQIPSLTVLNSTDTSTYYFNATNITLESNTLY